MTDSSQRDAKPLLRTYVILAALIAIGVGMGIVRMLYGIGPTTNLSDSHPWGLWIVYDVFFVPFAAGAFIMLLITYFYHREEYHDLVRPVVLAGFLGELMIVAVLIMDLGRWQQFYNVLFPWYWNVNSFMFLISIALTLYVVIVILELSPIVLEKLNWQKPLKIIKTITIFLAGIGIILSAIHQTAIGSLFLLMPYRLNALWWTPMLPLIFFVAAIFGGLSMAILVSIASARLVNRPVKIRLLSDLGKMAAIVLGIYMVLKFADILAAGEFGLLFSQGSLSLLFWAEILVGVVAPLVLFALRQTRERTTGLVIASVLVFVGLGLNRFNVALVGQETTFAGTYFPSWIEITISLSAILAGVLIFAVISRTLPVYPGSEDSQLMVVFAGQLPKVIATVGGVFVVVAVATILLLRPMVMAEAARLDPASQEPARAFAVENTENCEACHLDSDALLEAGADSADLERLTIELPPEGSAHSNIACVTCHQGNICPKDMEVHPAVVGDPGKDYSDACVRCHSDLPSVFPDDRLKTPHDEVSHGATVDVYCSDCHGATGHGFDPVTHEQFCTMSVCIGCHVDRNLDVELNDCDTCHLPPHEPMSVSCESCHSSTESWDQADASDHPMSLVGKHAEQSCFSCHQYPNFDGLDSTCTACHTPAHEFGGDDCAACHDPAQKKWSIADAGWDGHISIWPEYVGAHAALSCFTCHDDPSFKGLDSTCGACHLAPHEFGGDDCSECHDAAAGNWALEGGTWDGHAEVWPAYAGKHATLDCGTCHGGEAFSEMPDTCVECHTSGHEFGGDDCAACHDVTAGWAFEGEGWAGHADIWPYYAGAHTEVGCIGCHIDGYDVSPDCVTCHTPPRSHGSSGYPEDCSMCHDPAEKWAG